MSSKESSRVERPGHKSMVLVDSEYHGRWRATCEFIAQHPNWKRELAAAHKEYREGRFIPLETVLAELGLSREAATPTKRRKATRGTARHRATKSR